MRGAGPLASTQVQPGLCKVLGISELAVAWTVKVGVRDERTAGTPSSPRKGGVAAVIGTQGAGLHQHTHPISSLAGAVAATLGEAGKGRGSSDNS